MWENGVCMNLISVLCALHSAECLHFNETNQLITFGSHLDPVTGFFVKIAVASGELCAIPSTHAKGTPW